MVEKYTVDPYDRNRPAPGDGYSPTSKLINFGTRFSPHNKNILDMLRKDLRL